LRRNENECFYFVAATFHRRHHGKSVLETQICSVVEGPWRLRLRSEWVNPQGTRAPAGDSEHDRFQSPDSDDYSATEGLEDVSGVTEPRQ
jgi:hypothetical protein